MGRDLFQSFFFNLGYYGYQAVAWGIIAFFWMPWCRVCGARQAGIPAFCPKCYAPEQQFKGGI